MKPKIKTGISFAETVDVVSAMDTLLHIQTYTMNLYEKESLSTQEAQEEANKLIFSKTFYALSDYTIAQWIAQGGLEKKAFEVIKDLISEAVEEKRRLDEQQLLISKVLTKH